MSGKESAVPAAARKALASALSRSQAQLDSAMHESSDFSLQAAPSVDLYLATAKQEKKGVAQRPGMSSLFDPAPATVENVAALSGANDDGDGAAGGKSSGAAASNSRRLSTHSDELSAHEDDQIQEGRMDDDEASPEGKTSSEPLATMKAAGAAAAAASAGRNAPVDEDDGKTKFGMFEGVFARCLLNIWGVIMFLRMGWMVAHAGAWLASSIIVVAMIITLITTLSLSAICTNGEVKSGGAYFLISRSLGPQFGGAIGILFSLANATAVALHLIGFAETLFGIYNGTAKGVPYPPPPEYYGGVNCGCVTVNGIETCAGEFGAWHLAKHGIAYENTTAASGLMHEAGFLTHCGFWDERLIAIVSLILLISVALVGVEWVVKFQLFLLFLLVASLLSYFIGTFAQPAREAYAFTGYNYTVLLSNVGPDFRGGESWITLFSVFFPASTGIMAGANISGDLKDAQKAIPVGTLAAVIVSGITYIAMVWTLASICSREGGRGGLFNDFAIMMPASMDWIEESAVAPLIVAGIVASSLSSALAALVGAPRVFQAVCKDPLFPILKPFAKGRGANEEPINAYCLTFLIAVGFMMIGSLNAIAPFITNFFMISYAMINFAAFYSEMSGSPGWRPTWTAYNPWVSLLGSVLCLGSMFMISWYVALVTLFVCYGLYMYVGHLKPDVDWGSVGNALTYRRAVESLMGLGRSKQAHVKNYRISCVVMAGVPGRRSDLVFFFDQLRKGGGLMVAGNVIRGSLNTSEFISPLLTAHLNNNYYSKFKFKAVQEVVVAPTLVEGARMLLLTCGVGKLRPNTLGFGFREAWGDYAEAKLTYDYVQAIRDALRLNFSVCVLRNYTHNRYGKREIAVDISVEEESGSLFASSGSFDASSPNSPQKMNKPDRVSTVGLIGHIGGEGVDLSDAQQIELTERNAQKATPEAMEAVANLDIDDGTVTNRNIISTKRRTSFHMGKASRMRSETMRVDRQQRAKRESKNDTASTQRLGRFWTAKRTGFIDVWWLDDSGGLTMLLPHILRKKKQWSGVPIRLFVLHTGGADGAQTKDEQREEVETLLRRVRIPVHKVEVVDKPKSTDEEKEKAKMTLEDFEENMSADECRLLLSKFSDVARGGGNGVDATDSTADATIETLRQQVRDLGTYRASARRIADQHALGRLVKDTALDDTLLIIATMQFPRTAWPSLVYMAMLDAVSGPCEKPFLFVRGTQRRILSMET